MKIKDNLIAKLIGFKKNNIWPKAPILRGIAETSMDQSTLYFQNSSYSIQLVI